MPEPTKQFLPAPRDLLVLLPVAGDQAFAVATPTQFRGMAGEMLRTGLEKFEQYSIPFLAIEFDGGLSVSSRTYNVNLMAFDLGDPLRVFDDRFNVIDIDLPEAYRNMSLGQRLMLMAMMVLRPRYFKPFREIMTRMVENGFLGVGKMRGGAAAAEFDLWWHDTLLTGMTTMTAYFYTRGALQFGLGGSRLARRFVGRGPWGLLLELAFTTGYSLWTISGEVEAQENSDALLQRLGPRDVAVAEFVALLRGGAGARVSMEGLLVGTPPDRYIQDTIGAGSPWRMSYLYLLGEGLKTFLGEVISKYTEDKIPVDEAIQMVADDVDDMLSKIADMVEDDVRLLGVVSVAEARVLSRQYLANTVPLLLAPFRARGFANLLFSGLPCPKHERAITLDKAITARTSLGGRIRAWVQIKVRSIALRVFPEILPLLNAPLEFREVFVKQFEWTARLISVSLRTLGLDKYIGLYFNPLYAKELPPWLLHACPYPVVGPDGRETEAHLLNEEGTREVFEVFLQRSPEILDQWAAIGNRLGFGLLGYNAGYGPRARKSGWPAVVGGLALGAGLIYGVPKLFRLFGK